MLCEINKHIRPALTVMDGVVAMDGRGPTQAGYILRESCSSARTMALNAGRNGPGHPQPARLRRIGARRHRRADISPH